MVEKKGEPESFPVKEGQFTDTVIQLSSVYARFMIMVEVTFGDTILS